jgi:hypothetical protein
LRRLEILNHLKLMYLHTTTKKKEGFMAPKVVKSLQDIKELEIDFSSTNKPTKKARKRYTAKEVADILGVSVKQVLEANDDKSKTKGSDLVSMTRVKKALSDSAKADVKTESKTESTSPEPDAKTLLNAEFFEGEPAPLSNDAWAEQEVDGSYTSVEVPASTMAGRLGIKLKQLLKLFGIEFNAEDDETNGLKLLDEAEAERLFKEACEFDAIVKADVEAEAKAKADAEAEAKAKAKAKASADAEAKAKADAKAKAKEEKQQPEAEAQEAYAENLDVPSIADHIDRIRQTENAKAKAEAEAKSEADIAEAIARIKKEAEAKSKDETKVEVEASAKAETKVEAKDEQPPVPYIVCGPKAEEPEAPEAPQLKDTLEETPPNDTAPEGTVDFDDEFTQKFLDQAQSVIMQIESLA